MVVYTFPLSFRHRASLNIQLHLDMSQALQLKLGSLTTHIFLPGLLLPINGSTPHLET